MLRLLRNKKAQNTMEYALLISIVIGVFSAMQIYLRRGLQGRIKAGADQIPDKVISLSTETGVTNLFGSDTQYEPYYIEGGKYNISTTSGEGTEKGTITDTGGVRDLSGAVTKRTGEQQILGSE